MIRSVVTSVILIYKEQMTFEPLQVDLQKRHCFHSFTKKKKKEGS